jgi:tetratricopeptide (TPR) repeat protein
MTYYDKALAIDPHNVNALNNKGAALYNLGNYTGAITYYDKALAIDPHKLNIHQ